MKLNKLGKAHKKRVADIFEKLAVTFFGLVGANSLFSIGTFSANFTNLITAFLLGVLMSFLSYHYTEEESNKQPLTKKGKK